MGMSASRYLAETEIEQSEDSTVVVDLYGRITHLNDALCRSVGFSREELIGATPAVWLGHDGEFGGVTNRIIAACVKDGSWSGTVDYRSLDRGLGIRRVHASLVHDPDGRVVGVISSCREIRT